MMFVDWRFKVQGSGFKVCVAGDLLAGMAHAPKRVVLMHLSETNNSPRLARNSAEAALGHQGTELLLAQQHQPLELDPARDQQLQLGI